MIAAAVFCRIRQNATKLVMPWNRPWPIAPPSGHGRTRKAMPTRVSSAPCGEIPDDRCRRNATSRTVTGWSATSPRSAVSAASTGTSTEPLGPEDESPAEDDRDSPATRRRPERLAARGDGKARRSPAHGASWSPVREPQDPPYHRCPAGPGHLPHLRRCTGTVIAIGRSEDCAKALFEISRNPRTNRTS